jgi:hypothetical protein
MKRMLTRNIPVMLVAILTLATLTFAGVPQTINYQGYLKTTGGAPVTGQLGMTFSLYSSNPPRNDNHVWRETKPAVAVANGIYSVQLGSVTPIAAPFDVPYYLGIKVNGEELPLLPLSSAPYALRADVADTFGEGSITATMISDGAVGPDKLADTCAVGQILRQGASGWECGARPY